MKRGFDGERNIDNLDKVSTPTPSLTHLCYGTNALVSSRFTQTPCAIVYACSLAAARRREVQAS